MSAQTEIESLIEELQRSYNASPDATNRADLLGREALKGLVILAKHIDDITERVDGINSKDGEQSTDVSARESDLLGRAALSSLVVLATHIDGIAEKVDAISEGVDRAKPQIIAESLDISAELADLRRQLKKLTRAVKRLSKTSKKGQR